MICFSIIPETAKGMLRMAITMTNSDALARLIPSAAIAERLHIRGISVGDFAPLHASFTVPY